MKHKVFVYGSLRRGFSNHFVLRNSEFITHAVVKGLMIDLGAFPGVDFNQDGRVHGEVYKIDNKTLKLLDKLEGHPNFYQRIRVELNDKTQVWCYHLSIDKISYREIVKSGDWTKRNMKYDEIVVEEQNE